MFAAAVISSIHVRMSTTASLFFFMSAQSGLMLMVCLSSANSWRRCLISLISSSFVFSARSSSFVLVVSVFVSLTLYVIGSVMLFSVLSSSAMEHENEDLFPRHLLWTWFKQLSSSQLM